MKFNSIVKDILDREGYIDFIGRGTLSDGLERGFGENDPKAALKEESDKIYISHKELIDTLKALGKNI